MRVLRLSYNYDIIAYIIITLPPSSSYLLDSFLMELKDKLAKNYFTASRFINEWVDEVGDLRTIRPLEHTHHTPYQTIPHVAHNIKICLKKMCVFSLFFLEKKMKLSTSLVSVCPVVCVRWK